MNLPPPEIPTWAEAWGIPVPLSGEGFCEYAERIGLDPVLLTEDLNPRAAAVANCRLASALQDELPIQFSHHVSCLVERFVPTGERLGPLPAGNGWVRPF